MKTKETLKSVMVILVILILSGAAQADLDSGLVAHWTFDEGQGDVANDSAGDNEGSLHGNPRRVPGKIGEYALEFDANDDYVSLSKNAITTKEFTVSAWANHFAPAEGQDFENVIFQQRGDEASPTAKSTVTLLTQDQTNSYAGAGVRSSSAGEIQVLSSEDLIIRISDLIYPDVA